MPLLLDVAFGQKIEAAHINDRYDENYLWADDVDAGGHALSNVAAFRTSNNSRFVVNSVSLADDATVALETLTDSTTNGLLIIGSNSNGNCYGLVALRGGVNTATKISDAADTIRTADTDGFVCVMADGDSTYTLKNRLGSTQVFSLLFIGSSS